MLLLSPAGIGTPHPAEEVPCYPKPRRLVKIGGAAVGLGEGGGRYYFRILFQEVQQV